MSEVSDHGEEETGFSRRTIVKGAAWSVPVIAAAIAAPAASASEVSATVAFDAPGGTVPYPEDTNSGQNRTGTGPTGFHIQNTAGAITGTVSGSIRIEPIPAASGDPGIGVRTLTTAGSPLAMGSPVLTAANIFTASFNVPGVASNATVTIATDFYYRGKKNQQRNFLMTVILTFPGGRIDTKTSPLVLT